MRIYKPGYRREFGKAIPLRTAKDGARSVVCGNAVDPHSKLPGTIYTAAKESWNEGTWQINLKIVDGSSGAREPKMTNVVTCSLSNKDFHQLSEQNVNVTSADRPGPLKAQSNLHKPMPLENVMKRMKARGYHTLSNYQYPLIINNKNRLSDVVHHSVAFTRKYSDKPPENFTSVPAIFERMNAVTNAEMVGKVNACYVFELEGSNEKYYIDLKEGDGQAGEGDVPNKKPNFKPDVKITMNENNMLKMFNKELTPSTAFMTGKLKLSGDLAKALALQTVLQVASDV